MGIYRLCDGYELKGWRDVPYALVNSEKHLFRKLKLGVFFFLLSCDGTEDLEDIPEAEEFVKRGIIERLDEPREKTGEYPTYERLDQLHRPRLQLAITGRCNLHCRHCLAADGDKNVGTQLTLEECNHIFDEMIENDIFELWITGGEPFMHPDFRAIFQSAVEHGLRVTSIFTNAWLIDSEILDFITSLGQKPRVVVSFDGLGTHDWMRNREGAESHTLERIRLLREHGFPVRVGLNVNSVTAPRAIETCRMLAREYGVGSIRPIYTSPTPRWHAALKDGVEPLSPGDYYDLMIELVRASRVEGWGVEIDVIHMPKIHQVAKNPRTWDLLRTPPKPRPERAIMSSCGRACDVLFVGSDGRAMPCSTYEGASSAFGWFQGDDVNILRTPLKEILSSSEYAKEFEVTISDLEKSDSDCAGCAWLSICCGGCPLYTRGRRHEIYAGNPICIMYKGGYATKYLEMLEETEDFAWAKGAQRNAECKGGDGAAQAAGKTNCADTRSDQAVDQGSQGAGA